MKHPITIELGANILALSFLGSRLPANVEQKIKDSLRYNHKTFSRQTYGSDRSNNCPISVEVRNLFHFDHTTQRLIASIGWMHHIADIVQSCGYSVEVFDREEPHPSVDRYTTDWSLVFRRMSLRARQDEMLAALDSRDYGVLKVPPGVGKTFLITAYALAKPKARIHIITDGIDIVDRIYKLMVKFFPNVGAVGGGRCRFGDRITVISADSLHKVAEGFNDYRDPKSPDVVFFDEVHKASSPSIMANLLKYRRCRRYGLSANFGDRFDGSDRALIGIFGEVVFEMSYQEAVALDLVVPVAVDWVDVSASSQSFGNLKDYPLERAAIYLNDERNRKIADKLKSYSNDSQVLLMVSKVQHAVALQQFLPDFRLCYDQCEDYDKLVAAGLIRPELDPKMTKKLRDRMRAQFESGDLRKVIATDVWSTGVDFVGLSILARADARDSRIMDTQIPGRANRIHELKSCATLIDCYDGFHPNFRRKSLNRKKYYDQQSWNSLNWPNSGG